MNAEERIRYAESLTRVVRTPRRHLATFGSTKLPYYMITEPSYDEWVSQEDESVIRQGVVMSERPKIVTPDYMLTLQGFSEDAYVYMEKLAQVYGHNSPGILYEYKNEPGKLNIVSGKVHDVADRVAGELNRLKEDNSVVLTGMDALWDVSLLKFIYEYTYSSALSNTHEMEAMGLLDPVPDFDIPAGVIQRIEEMFQAVRDGLDPGLLHKELVRWKLFKAYEARFFSLFDK